MGCESRRSRGCIERVRTNKRPKRDADATRDVPPEDDEETATSSGNTRVHNLRLTMIVRIIYGSSSRPFRPLVTYGGLRLCAVYFMK